MTQSADGVLTTRDGRSHLRYERRLTHPVDAVWDAVTSPDRMAEWWAAADELDLREGGRVRLRWLNSDEDGNVAIAEGTVSELDPPRVLELDTDIHGVLRFELAPDGDGTLLVFTATLDLPDEYRTKVLAGWHSHLDFLEDALAGRPVDWENWPLDRWESHHERYVAQASG